MVVSLVALRHPLLKVLDACPMSVCRCHSVSIKFCRMCSMGHLIQSFCLTSYMYSGTSSGACLPPTLPPIPWTPVDLDPYILFFS